MGPTGARPSLSLEQRIRNAEGRLAQRRRSAGAHLADVKGHGRAVLAAPMTLLAALGVGVALGQLIPKRRRGAPVPATGAAKSPGTLVTLFDALRMAAPVAAILSSLDAVSKVPAPQPPSDRSGGRP